MVIWVAVGGRGTLIGAIIGTVLVSIARTLLSEQFSDIWLFFQGGLFLIVVTALPDGLVGWLRNQGPEQIRLLLGRPRQLITYPRLAEDPDVEYERQNFRN